MEVLLLLSEEEEEEALRIQYKKKALANGE
jgi:hypothetical protein